MEIKWLEDFLTLADTRSFSRAAEIRLVTQPAFSRRIRALESWLGAELVLRSAYPMRLTRAGELFRDDAALLLKHMLESRALVRGELGSAEEAVKFAAPHTLALTFFPKWLADVEQRFGAVSTRLVAANVHDAVASLVEGNCDLLLCYHHPHHPVELDPARYPMLHLGVESILPYSGTLPDGAPRYRLPGTAAAPIPYLAYTPTAYLGLMVEMVLHSAPGRCWLERRYETDMAEALKVMALEGHGIAWLPDSAVVREVKARQLALAVRPAAMDVWRGRMDIRLYRDREHTRPLVAKLWAQLEATAVPE